MDVGAVTVVVGPNNGGKSTLLADLHTFTSRGQQSHFHMGGAQPWEGGIVVQSAEVSAPTSMDEVTAFMEAQDGYSALARKGMFAVRGQQQQLDINVVKHAIDRNDRGLAGLALLSPYVLSLNGRERFNLAQQVESGALNASPTNHWMAIERDRGLYERVDKMISEAFGEHLVLQTFVPPQIQPALGATPVPEVLWQSSSEAAIALQEKARPLKQLSDGVQVFCGLVAAVATLPHLLILVDEPEAFLHPTLSRRLGADLARIARERDARLITATHSVDFLLGCIDEVPETTVLRVGRTGSVASSHLIEADEVARLARDPLLRSSNALRALFARSSVVCEADADRAFYEEINRRLMASDDFDGAKDCEFINAQNWQTSVRIAAPLRAAGVPTAVVLDADTLVQDDKWSELVGMAGLTNDRRDAVLLARASARDAIKKVGRVASAEDAPYRVKAQGVDSLPDEEKAIVVAAIELLAEIGIFVVDVGELENWLSTLGRIPKNVWVPEMFLRLGTPGGAVYIEPQNADVWLFVQKVARWLENPVRDGVPVS